MLSGKYTYRSFQRIIFMILCFSNIVKYIDSISMWDTSVRCYLRVPIIFSPTLLHAQNWLFKHWTRIMEEIFLQLWHKIVNYIGVHLELIFVNFEF
jgi:hypothetical protein